MSSEGREPPRSRKVYNTQFKLRVVEYALQLPQSNRIKPTARAFPGVEPVQVRKWIRRHAAGALGSKRAEVDTRDEGDDMSETESTSGDENQHQIPHESKHDHDRLMLLETTLLGRVSAASCRSATISPISPPPTPPANGLILPTIVDQDSHDAAHDLLFLTQGH